MTSFDRKKAIESVLYILDRTGGVDFYHTFKILYFAEMKHLSKWGSKIIGDVFCALPYGPVPSQLYDAVKHIYKGWQCDAFSQELGEAVAFAGDDAPNVMLAKRTPDMQYISTSEKEAIDASIEENATLSFEMLKMKSHDAAWNEAFMTGCGNKSISPLSMAKVIATDDAMLDYIKEQEEIEHMLS